MRQALLFLICILALIPPSSAQSDIYKIVPEESKFLVEVGSAGVFGFLGHTHYIRVREFSGDVTIPPADGGAALDIVAKAASLYEEGKFSEKDKQTIESAMHENVLESATYPEIRFKSKDVKIEKNGSNSLKASIRGDLHLHGVTREIVIPAAITTAENSLRATGKFVLDRDDFKIKAESAGGGTVKVDDKLKISFDIVARR